MTKLTPALGRLELSNETVAARAYGRQTVTIGIDAAEAIVGQQESAEQMREALEPFAALGGPNDGVMPAFHDLDDDVVVYHNSGRGITAGDVRNARRLIGWLHAPTRK